MESTHTISRQMLSGMDAFSKPVLILLISFPFLRFRLTTGLTDVSQLCDHGLGEVAGVEGVSSLGRDRFQDIGLLQPLYGVSFLHQGPIWMNKDLSVEEWFQAQFSSVCFTYLRVFTTHPFCFILNCHA